MSSFLLIIVGLFIAGPWLTMAAARAMARWTSRPATLIAARRLADDPRAAFRAVSGLVLALFITTVAVVAITTQNAKNLTRFGTRRRGERADRPGIGIEPGGRRQRARERREHARARRPGPAAPVAPLTARLSGIHGVQGVLVVRADPGLTIPGTFQRAFGGNLGSTVPVPAGVVSCAQLATVPALGRCPAGAATAAVPGGRVRTAPCSARTPPRSPGRPRTSRPRGWTPSAWTPSTWDGRQHAGGRAGQDGARERARLPRRHRAVHHRRPRRAGQSPRTATTSSSRTW